MVVDKEELKKRTKQFAHRCVKLCNVLPNSDLGRLVSGQLLRSSTSVASNYRATCVAQSKPSFIAKISIVVEESDESLFWLEFIIDEELFPKEKVEPLMKEANELVSIFISSRKTASGK